MGEPADHLEALELRQTCLDLVNVVGGKAQSMHAAIDFHPGFQRRPDVVFERGKLAGVEQHQLKAMLAGLVADELVELLRQHRDRFVDAGPAQLQRFIQTRYGEAVCLVQRAGDRHRPMAVAIGLDRCVDAAAGGERTYPSQVMRQGAAIDDCLSANHDVASGRQGLGIIP